MSRTSGELVESYLRSLQWQVPLAVVAIVGLWGFDTGGIRDLGFARVLFVGIGCFVVLSPVLWVRHQFTWEKDRQMALLLGLSVVWLVVGALVVLVLSAVVD